MNLRIRLTGSGRHIMYTKRKNIVITDEAEAELNRNDIYKISDVQTKKQIKYDLIRYSAKHRLPINEAAKLFALRSDCGFSERKKESVHYHLIISTALICSTITAAALDSFWLFFLLLLPFLTICFEFNLRIENQRFRHKTLPSLEKIPECPSLTAIFLKTNDIDYLKKCIEKRINTNKNKNMSFAVLIFQKPSAVIYSKDDAIFYEKLSNLQTEIKNLHGSFISIYVIKRSYDPARHIYECTLSETDALYAMLNNDRSCFELALVPDKVLVPDTVVCIAGDADISESASEALIKSALHPLNCSENCKEAVTFIAADVIEFVPIKHTLFSPIASVPQKNTHYALGILHQNDKSLPSRVCAVNTASFLKFYCNNDLNYAICEEATVCFPKPNSPIKELFAPPYISNSRFKGPAGILYLISYLSPVWTLALAIISALIRHPAGAVLFSATVASFLSDIIISFSLTDGISSASFFRRAAYYITFLSVKGIYCISLLPSLFIMRIFGTVRVFTGTAAQKKDSAGHFFLITLCSVLSGIPALSSGIFLLRFFGSLFVLAPVFTIVLTIPVGTKRRRSHIINDHLARSYEAYTEFWDRKSTIIFENEKCDSDENTFSPSELGMYLCAALAYYDLELIPVHELYVRVSDILDILYSLPTADGLFYDCNYLSTSGTADDAEISIKENGILFTCLIALCDGLSDIFGQHDITVKRCEALISRADLAHLASNDTEISDISDPSAFVATCFSGNVSISDKMPSASYSCTGGASSLLFPYLFLPVYPYTETQRNIRRYYRASKRLGKSGMFGVTSCVDIRLDDSGNNIYGKDFGIPEFAFMKVPDHQPFSPYACIAMLCLHPSKVIASLYSYKAHGALGKKGFYDSVFIDKKIKAVKSYSLLNVCASVIAADNFYNDGIFNKRFSRSPFVAPYLKCLRAAHKRPAVISETNIPAKYHVKHEKNNEKYDVPRICFLRGKSFAVAASDEEHIVLFSDGKNISSNCFDRYDMSNTSDSLTVFCRADGRCFDALSGDFSYDRLSVTYGSNHKTFSSKVVFSLSDNESVLKIKLTVKGDISDVSAVMSFNTPLDFVKSGDALVSENLRIYTIGGKEEYAFCEDGVCEIAVSDKDCEGYFSCEYVFEAVSDRSAYIMPYPKSGLLTESILASYFLCAGMERKTECAQKITNADLSRPLITAEMPSPAVNLTVISDLSKYCDYLRTAGIDIYLAVIAEECDFSSIVGFLNSSDFIITSHDDAAKNTASYSIMYIDAEGMTSPEKFFIDIMSHSRRLPALKERAVIPESIELPKGICVTGASAFKGKENILIKTVDSENAVFSLGGRLSILLESDRLEGIYYDDRKICECLLLSISADDGDYDIIASSYTIEKNGCIALYKTKINKSEIFTEVFCDERFQSIIIRVICNGCSPSLLAIPKAPCDDPRLIEHSFSDGAVFFSSRYDKFLSENKIFVKELMKCGTGAVFAVGIITNGDAQNYYRLCEKYSFSFGCESPIARASLLTVKSEYSTADHMISVNIPEQFSGSNMAPENKIYAFPYLALTEPDMLKNTIREFAPSAEISGKDSIILPAALAAYYSFTGDDSFLRDVVEFRDGIRESIYLRASRIIESFIPQSGEEAFMLGRLITAFEHLSRSMNDIILKEIDNVNVTEIHDPVIKAAYLLESGKNSDGCWTLMSCLPDFYENDPRKLSVFYYVYMYDLIGIHGENGIIGIAPKLSVLFRKFKMTLKRGNTTFHIEANLGDKNETIQDGIMINSGLVCDGRSHTLNITAAENNIM